MPSNRSVATPVGPTLLFWVVITAALALFGAASTIALVVIDDRINLPDPMVSSCAVFAGTTTIVSVMLGVAHMLRVAGVANTRAAVAAITDTRSDLKEDTGDIRARVRRAEVIVVREPEPGWPHDAAAVRREEPSIEDSEALPPGMATQIWTMAERATERRLRGDAPA